MTDPVGRPARPFFYTKDKQVTCPFNSLHVMTNSSLQRHIIRCMKNYPHFVNCPFNSLHWFANRNLLQKHMEGCTSKPVEMTYKNKEHDELIHVFDNKIDTSDTEDWDAEYEQ